MSYKLLVEDNGIQEVKKIGETGSYYDPRKIIWDEREHGELPDISVGGLYRITTKDPLGNDVYSLQINKEKQAEQDIAKLALKDSEDEKQNYREDRVRDLKLSLSSFESKTAAEKWALVKKLIEVL